MARTQSSLVSFGGESIERDNHQESDDHSGDEPDLLTLSEPSEYQCDSCGFSGGYWDFDSINPIKEKYRRKEREATDYRERRSARKNRIRATYHSVKSCPDCDAYGDGISEIGGDE